MNQLARIHLFLGDLASAEREAHAAREIRESLGLKEAWKDYYTLSEIAAARGDGAKAAEWARKCDELHAEVERRAGGSPIPGDMLRALEALTVACARAGFGGESLDPAEEEALAKLDSFPVPFPDFSSALRRLAAGELPTTTVDLPPELKTLLDGITNAIRDRS